MIVHVWKDYYQGRDRENAEEAAASIVSELRTKIETETGLTASAGIACNKRLAKVGIEKILLPSKASRWPLT